MSDVVLAGGQQSQPGQVPAVQYLGAPARVDLLPEEIQREAAVRATRRVAIFGVILAIVIAGAGYAYSLTVTSSAQAQLANAQSQTSALQKQQAGFAPVRQLQQQLGAIGSVENVVESTRIDWVAVDAHLHAGAPGDAVFGGTSYSAQSPTTGASQSSGIFAKPAIGSASISMTTSDYTGLTAWLDALAADPVFAGVTANTVANSNQTQWSVSAQVGLSPSLTPLPDPTPTPAPTGAAG